MDNFEYDSFYRFAPSGKGKSAVCTFLGPRELGQSPAWSTNPFLRPLPSGSECASGVALPVPIHAAPEAAAGNHPPRGTPTQLLFPELTVTSRVNVVPSVEVDAI